MSVIAYGVNDTKKQVVDFAATCPHPEDVLDRSSVEIAMSLLEWSPNLNSVNAYRVAEAAVQMGVERMFYDTFDDYDTIEGYEVVGSVCDHPIPRVGERISD